ncbi:DUF305 domain-containing protein [Streptomyces sp. NPDC020883]|uniref:DUF305 domain-containing protein n=1 Tax=Streptomyces sp. NPDC020883 TaxID=3365099 RepID=UPI003797BDEA
MIMKTSRSLPRRAAAMTAAAAVAALALTACGNGTKASEALPATPAAPSGTTASAPASAPAGRHNKADVAFAQGMIPHHRQAVAMADMVVAHGSSNEVKALAEKVEQEQSPEIQTMTTWLKSWGQRVPQGMNEMPGMGHGGPSAMPGMMSDRQMNQLKGTSGAACDRMFLTMMIEHHQGAIEMANTEKRQGAYGPAKKMARNIVTSQTAEIAQMRKMLGTGVPSPTGH